VWLTADAPTGVQATAGDAVEFHDQQLIGLAVRTVAGEPVGEVTGILHHRPGARGGRLRRPAHPPPGGQDLLVVGPAARSPRAGEVLVPFVAAIVVEVDLPGGELIIDPPPGLLELAAERPGAAPGGPAPAGPSRPEGRRGKPRRPGGGPRRRRP
jgi:16S rRNA processing protein RimM